MGLVFGVRSFRCDALRDAADIAVATPGRLVDHINDSVEQMLAQTLGSLRYLVVDEMDRLLNQSYQGWLEIVLQVPHLLHGFILVSLRRLLA